METAMLLNVCWILMVRYAKNIACGNILRFVFRVFVGRDPTILSSGGTGHAL
jgi:hypothetical protein